MDGLEPTSPLPERRSSGPTEPMTGSDDPAPVMSSLTDDPAVGTTDDGKQPGSLTTVWMMPDKNGPFPRDFGRYRLLEWLGGGGMGTVYLAQDLKLEIKVALKIPRPRLIGDPRLKERFYREARYAARLIHAGLAWVLDVGQVDGTDYLVMRYVPGTPLSRYPGGTPRESAAMIRDVATAMAAAHREGRNPSRSEAFEYRGDSRRSPGRNRLRPGAPDG